MPPKGSEWIPDLQRVMYLPERTLPIQRPVYLTPLGIAPRKANKTGAGGSVRRVQWIPHASWVVAGQGTRPHRSPANPSLRSEGHLLPACGEITRNGALWRGPVQTGWIPWPGYIPS